MKMELEKGWGFRYAKYPFVDYDTPPVIIVWYRPQRRCGDGKGLLAFKIAFYVKKGMTKEEQESTVEKVIAGLERMMT